MATESRLDGWVPPFFGAAAGGLVELHGGEFTLRSKVREGTEVIISFPPERVMNALASIDPDALTAQIREAADGCGTVVIEGVGGLLVPLAPGYDVRELARDLELRLVIAARTGLGTINHTLLTLEAARSAQLDVAAVVLTPWPEGASAIERSNRDTIAHLGGVATLPRVGSATPEQLAAAGATLPLAQWLG